MPEREIALSLRGDPRLEIKETQHTLEHGSLSLQIPHVDGLDVAEDVHVFLNLNETQAAEPVRVVGNNTRVKAKIFRRIELEKRQMRLENEWKLPGNRSIDKRIVKFGMQFGLGVMMLSFSLYKLADETLSCEAKTVYTSLLMMIIGVFVPNPNITAQRQD